MGTFPQGQPTCIPGRHAALYCMQGVLCYDEYATSVLI